MFAGARSLSIVDEPNGLSFPALVMYPTRIAPAPVGFGPYSIDVARDAPAAEGSFPLVVVSHGSGGSHLVYRTIAAHLAKNGYVVAMPEHPGNNRNDNRLNGTLENLVYRPRHLRLTIDSMYSDPHLQDRLRPDAVAILGHSMGGYTALAVAGGKPRSETEVEVVTDGRVKALVLMAPAAAWYTAEGSLRDVRAPILMLLAEHDPFTTRWHADLILSRLPEGARITCRTVENAGHFSFLSPFPPAMRSPSFPPSTDPPGFDRDAFHERLPAELLEFLAGAGLPPGRPPG